MIEVPAKFERGMIGEFREYAFEAHGDQLYGRGPALQRQHLDEGAVFLNSLGYQTTIVAGYYLHDVDEDTGISIARIQKDLKPEIFIVEGLYAISSPKGETREEQTRRAAGHPVSAVWKYGDSFVNIAAKVNHPSLIRSKQVSLSNEYVYSAYEMMQVMLSARGMRAYVAQRRRLQRASQ